jgi:hypothetical protein
MRVDFTEIPTAAGGTRGSDDWEFFARDFLQALGVLHQSGPDRGPDDGRDLLMVETRTGALGAKDFRWVVSCKHNAHGGGSVSDRDEIDIVGRVRKFRADGFIGFYSTLPSSTLARTFEAHRGEIEVAIFDAARIEHELLTRPKLRTIFKRYFPKSATTWEHDRIAPFPLADVYEPLECEGCHTDLLTKEGKVGNIVFVSTSAKPYRMVRVFACCKECDRQVSRRYRSPEYHEQWTDVADLVIPRRFIEMVMALMNELQRRDPIYEEAALDEFKRILLRIAQVVVRETSPSQRRRLAEIDRMPPGL